MSSELKNRFLFTIFFLSGFAALIYQMAWQRLLFTIYGTNMESISMIVAIFMFGLGLGAILGGELSRNFGHLTLLFFLISEACIGVFGFFSHELICILGNHTIHSSRFFISIIVFVFLMIPTSCMGMTLPLLVEYMSRLNENVGKAVGSLYFVNTLGSAFACLMTVIILFGRMGLKGTIWFASVCNLIVAFSVYIHMNKMK